MRTVFVGNLNYKTDKYAIKDLFENYGHVNDVRISYGHNGYANGYAHVEFKFPENAREAVDRLDGYDLDDRPIRLDLATTIIKETSSRGGGRDYYD